MLHLALPQFLTVENLASWLVDNNIEKKIHVEEKPLTPDDISENEHKSSAASRAIDDLEELKKRFNDMIVKGTEEPIDFTIPPTKGTKTLEANRKYADKCIKDGVSKQETELYGIVYPETQQVLFFDIEGNEYPDHHRNMDPEEQENYNKPLLKAIKDEGQADGPVDDTEEQTEEKSEKKGKSKKKTAPPDFMGELDL